MVKWYHSSSFQYEDRKGKQSWATDEEELCCSLIYILKLRSDQFIKKNGKRAMIFIILSIIFFLAMIGGFIGAVVAGISVAAVDVCLIITAIYFASRKPKMKIQSLNKFYWPIGIVRRHDKTHTLVDTLNIVKKKSLRQNAYQLTNWLNLSAELKSIKPTSPKANRDLLFALDGFMFPILARKELVFQAPLIDLEENKEFYSLFYGQNSYPSFCLREYKPTHMLSFVYTMEEAEDLMKKLIKFDNYDNLILDTIQQVRLNIIDVIDPFKLKYLEEMSKRKKNFHTYFELLSECKNEIHITFEPVRNLLLKSYEPNKVVMDAISSINTAQLEMGNFLYLEQLRINKAETTAKVIEREQKEAEKVFQSIGEIKKQIDQKVSDFSTTIGKLKETKSQISKLEEKENALQKSKKRLERRLILADVEAKLRINSELEEIKTNLSSVTSNLKYTREDLRSLRKRATEITGGVSKLETEKRNFFEEQRRKRVERAKTRESLQRTSKESGEVISSKAKQLSKTSDDLIETKLQSLRQLIATVDVNFEKISGRIEWLINDGYYGEFLRNIDPLISRYYYLLSQNAIISNVLTDYESDAKFRYDYRGSFYRGEELKLPQGELLESVFVLIPIWNVSVKLADGKSVDYWYSMKKFSSDKKPKLFTNDLPITVHELSIVSSEIVNSFRESKVYEQEREKLNLLSDSKYKKIIKQHLIKLQSKKMISSRAKTLARSLL